MSAPNPELNVVWSTTLGIKNKSLGLRVLQFVLSVPYALIRRILKDGDLVKFRSILFYGTWQLVFLPIFKV